MNRPTRGFLTFLTLRAARDQAVINHAASTGGKGSVISLRLVTD